MDKDELNRLMAPKPAARDAEAERNFEGQLKALALRAKAVQRAEFVRLAVRELEELMTQGRPDFSPDYQAIWHCGIKQSIQRLKALTRPMEGA